MRQSAMLLLLTACVPSTLPEVEPWPDIIDLRDGRYLASEVDFELPWALPLEEIERPRVAGRQETVHACLLLPLSGERAEEGRDALEAALLAVESRAERPAAARRVRWHVEDTRNIPTDSVSAAQRCLDRQALLVAGPLVDRQVNDLVPAMSGRGLAVMIPEPGSASLERWDERFVAVGPPAPVMGRVLAEHAVDTSPPGVAAALVARGEVGRGMAERWMDRLAAGGWSRGPVLELPATDPSAWADALREAVEAGADAVLVGGGVPSAAMLLPVLRDEAPEVRLWMTDAGSQVALVQQAAHAGVVDRLRFTLRRWPSRGFRRAFAKRWSHRPLPASASVHDAVTLGYAAAESADFLTGPDMAAAARKARLPSAWGASDRLGEAPLDYTAAAGYDVAVAVQGSPEGGSVWTFVPVDDAPVAAP